MNEWLPLRRLTTARVALGRAGGSLRTREVLAFAADHAAARDAVHAELDWDRLEAEVRAISPCVRLSSAAGDRTTYLKRPDLGRTLDAASGALLRSRAADATPPANLAILVSDGLSAPAAKRQAVPLLAELLPMLKPSGIRVAPIFLVRHARVAIEDEVGHAIGAKCALILLGERPGLGTPDSLGAYLVFSPKPGRTDAERNCVSNIHPAGLTVSNAAATLHYLITQSLHRRLSGIALKDERTDKNLPGPLRNR